MFDDDNPFERDQILPVEDLWEQYGFSDQDIWLWTEHGFDDPETADKWRNAVEHADIAETLFSHGVPLNQASGWGRLIEDHGEDFPLVEAYNAVSGSATLAVTYNRHFPVEEWGMLDMAGVSARMTAAVFQLTSAIEARDRDRGLGADRERSIREAVEWAGTGKNVAPQRINLLQNLIHKGKTPSGAQFTLLHSENGGSVDSPAYHAIRVNDWLVEAGYAPDDRGLTVYGTLLNLDAATKDTGRLIRDFGLEAVFSALESGLKTLPQLRHHLKHGGVAEIARGVL
jgi:hypothetical protein